MKQLKITNKITNRDSDSIKAYLLEIGRIDLLTDEEEIYLAKKSREGSSSARQKLINANLRFVVSVAKQYQNQGMSLDDLICEGNIGLIKAAERFDDTKGFKFISYAVWWIRQSILSALADNSRIVRLPSNQITKLYKISKISESFEQENQREPTKDELAELMDEDPFKISHILSVKGRHASLDAPLSNDSSQEDSYSLYDVISAEEDNNIEELMSVESLKSDIDYCLNSLKSKRQKEIICMYFGISGYPTMTLEEIGEYFELTRERVRQIKDTTIRVLKHRSKSNILRQHLK
jgi:RNA polymerase primary sigma factor